MSQIDLPIVEVRGSARAMGEQHGEACREAIQDYVAHRLLAARTYLQDRGFTDEPPFRAAGLACLEALEAWDPDGHAEHCGTAVGANVDAADLYAATNYSDLRDLILLDAAGGADVEGCTAVAIPPAHAAANTILVGQTWDLHPHDVEYVVAIHRLPDHGPETWSVTCTGSPTLIGMNEHGLYVGTTNIKIRGVRHAVPYLSLLHRAIRERTAHEAAACIEQAPRAAAHTYWFADADHAVELECSATRFVRRDLDETPLTQTNHCLDPDHQALEAETPSDSSYARLTRIDDLLASRTPLDVDTIRTIFSDRSDGILSINRYPEDGQYAATNSCVIGVPAERAFHACRGPADRGTWHHLAFERIPQPS